MESNGACSIRPNGRCFCLVSFPAVIHCCLSLGFPTLANLMRIWNPVSAIGVVASFTWREHLTTTVPLCIAELLWVYITTGYYVRIDIAYDPDHLLTIFEWLLWLVGSEIHEL